VCSITSLTAYTIHSIVLSECNACCLHLARLWIMRVCIASSNRQLIRNSQSICTTLHSNRTFFSLWRNTPHSLSSSISHHPPLKWHTCSSFCGLTQHARLSQVKDWKETHKLMCKEKKVSAADEGACKSVFQYTRSMYVFYHLLPADRTCAKAESRGIYVCI
jgi:hypothetical protein